MVTNGSENNEINTGTRSSGGGVGLECEHRYLKYVLQVIPVKSVEIIYYAISNSIIMYQINEFTNNWVLFEWVCV